MVDKLVRDGNEDSENYDMVNQSNGGDADCEVDSHPSTGDTPIIPDNGEDISADPQRLIVSETALLYPTTIFDQVGSTCL